MSESDFPELDGLRRQVARLRRWANEIQAKNHELKAELRALREESAILKRALK